MRLSTVICSFIRFYAGECINWNGSAPVRRLSRASEHLRLTSASRTPVIPRFVPDSALAALWSRPRPRMSGAGFRPDQSAAPHAGHKRRRTCEKPVRYRTSVYILSFCQQFGYLNGVQCSPFQELIAANPKSQPIVQGSVNSETPDSACIFASRV
jgi:hypothetical protein